jgi:hypothetical protein
LGKIGRGDSGLVTILAVMVGWMEVEAVEWLQGKLILEVFQSWVRATSVMKSTIHEVID